MEFHARGFGEFYIAAESLPVRLFVIADYLTDWKRSDTTLRPKEVVRRGTLKRLRGSSPDACITASIRHHRPPQRHLRHHHQGVTAVLHRST